MRVSRLLYAPAAALLLSGCGNWAPLLPGTPAGDKNFWALVSGLEYTLLLSVYTIVIGSLIGLIGAVMARSRRAVVRRTVWLYVEAFRMVPLFVLLLWIYYALPIAIGELPPAIAGLPGLDALRRMEPFTAAIIGLSLNAGAFLVEIFRAGIESVRRSQIDAGMAFGMSRTMVMRRIILPQAVRRMLPPMTSQFISIVKDSSLAGVIGVMEVTRRATLLQTQILHPMEIYTFLTLEYMVILILLTALARHLERRYPQHG
ncbi:amino acid ABC transporter membrane protein (PAAT family) [Dongia mobilis]|uniref:Amino acid ABC transporter membrane protein (PAAT family) n=1 Tax=Dongia mobilis TaxID=578943 RepID=A0A4R6WSJ0_9PROT|nr:amino acid ABC transporter permease [Dongia mobilis]TDQ81573.1 amino acid ABC transporter membrane protein (PAAT family) [Dongia mobilis]